MGMEIDIEDYSMKKGWSWWLEKLTTIVKRRDSQMILTRDYRSRKVRNLLS